MKKSAKLLVLLVIAMLLLLTASAESVLKVEQAPVTGCIQTMTVSWMDVEVESATAYRLLVVPGDQAVTIGASGAADSKTFTPKETAASYTVYFQYEKTEYNEETGESAVKWFDYASVICAVQEGGHAFGEWVEEQPATCTEAGVLGHKICTRCEKNFDAQDEELTDLTIAALGHEMKKQAGQKENCMEDGWKDYVLCNRCGQYFEDEAGEKIIEDLEAWKLDAGKIAAPKIEHDWTSWYPEKSQVEEDMFERYCRVCKVHEYRFFRPDYVIAKLLKNDAAAPQELLAQHPEYTVFNGFYQVTKTTNTSVPDQYLSFKLRDKQMKVAEEGKKIVGLYIDANNRITEVDVKWYPDVTGNKDQHWVIPYLGTGVYALAERAK